MTNPSPHILQRNSGAAVGDGNGDEEEPLPVVPAGSVDALDAVNDRMDESGGAREACTNNHELVNTNVVCINKMQVMEGPLLCCLLYAIVVVVAGRCQLEDPAAVCS